MALLDMAKIRLGAYIELVLEKRYSNDYELYIITYQRKLYLQI